jgi:hypothetical protein
VQQQFAVFGHSAGTDRCAGTVLVLTGVRAQCWYRPVCGHSAGTDRCAGTVLVPTGVRCRLFVVPGAEKNAVRPREPTVTVSRSPEYLLYIYGDCCVRNVDHCVPQFVIMMSQ